MEPILLTLSCFHMTEQIVGSQNPDWLGNRIKLIKASILTGDREQAEIVAQQLADYCGEQGAEQLYESAVLLLNEAGRKPRAWWFWSLIGR